MKVVILAGGRGTRLGEETMIRPKPMVELGGKPILWHIMKYYSSFGLTEFVICLGYKGYMIKEFFSNYFLHTSDVTINLKYNSTTIHNSVAEPWQITLVETGETTMTGGRLRRVRNYIGEQDFCMTYGDGLSDVDLDALIAFHREHGKLASVTAVSPAARFGAMALDGERVVAFQEKPTETNDFVNGGFFVLSPKVLDLVEDDDVMWEREPMESLADRGELAAFRHHGFWHPMDMLRDKIYLDGLWADGTAPWKRW